MLPGDYQNVMQRAFNLERHAFEAWMLEGGTLVRASKLLENKGIINRKTKRPYTPMGIQQAAYRYIIYNHIEVRPIMENIWKDYGVTKVTNEMWEKYVVNMAAVILGNSSKKRFMKWLDKNPQFEKYEHMYAVRFGIEADRRTRDE